MLKEAGEGLRETSEKAVATAQEVGKAAVTATGTAFKEAKRIAAEAKVKKEARALAKEASEERRIKAETLAIERQTVLLKKQLALDKVKKQQARLKEDLIRAKEKTSFLGIGGIGIPGKSDYAGLGLDTPKKTKTQKTSLGTGDYSGLVLGYSKKKRTKYPRIM